MTDLTPPGPPGPTRPSSTGTVCRPAPVPPPAVTSRPRGHRRRRAGVRLALVALLLLTVTAGVILGGHLLSGPARPTGGTAAWAGSPVPDRTTGRTPAAPAPAPTSASAGPLLGPHPVHVQVDGYFSWALLDRRTGRITGSPNHATGTSTTESMIKSWIASDFLRRQAAAGSTPSQQRLAELTRMIRDSDDQAAQDIYEIGGGNAVVERMISICRLRNTTVFDYWWSKTSITADDATRLGLCVADGRAAGRTWTRWILGEMRQVRGEGRFGPVKALPADVAGKVAIKNGWTLIVADGNWHVACLAVEDQWILAVLTRYDGNRGLAYGAEVCAKVTRQLLNRP